MLIDCYECEDNTKCMSCSVASGQLATGNLFEQRQKIVYVCSPLRGDYEGNKIKAREYCRQVIKEGHIPIAVHLLFPQFLNDFDPEQREQAINMGLEVLKRCDELWVFGNKPSEGMKAEIMAAAANGIRIRQMAVD